MEYNGDTAKVNVGTLVGSPAPPIARVTLRARNGEFRETYARTRSRQWKWEDPYSNETWQMPINPNAMTTPHPNQGITPFVRNIPRQQGPNDHANGMARLYAQKKVPLDWQISGVIRSRSFYEEFVRWRVKKHLLYLHDDLGRRFHVHIREIDFEEDEPAPGHVAYNTRYTYTCKMLLYGVRG